MIEDSVFQKCSGLLMSDLNRDLGGGSEELVDDLHVRDIVLIVLEGEKSMNDMPCWVFSTE